MEVYQIDDAGCLFISPDIDDWSPIQQHGINVIVDLDGDLDIGIPTLYDQLLYIYYPFDDDERLPDLTRLHQVARMAATLISHGHRVLSHCGMGHNRSALLAGLILTYMGMPGCDAAKLLREKRQGALYNKTFYEYLNCCEAAADAASKAMPNMDVDP